MLRINTASVARQADSWKRAISERYNRFAGSMYFLLAAVGHRKKLLVPILLAVGMSLQFGAVQFGSIVVLGTILLKLHSYRLANVILRSLS